jgi:hypothetical protein
MICNQKCPRQASLTAGQVRLCEQLSDHYGQGHSLYGNLEFRTRTRGEKDVSLTRMILFADICALSERTRSWTVRRASRLEYTFLLSRASLGLWSVIVLLTLGWLHLFGRLLVLLVDLLRVEVDATSIILPVIIPACIHSVPLSFLLVPALADLLG